MFNVLVQPFAPFWQRAGSFKIGCFDKQSPRSDFLSSFRHPFSTKINVKSRSNCRFNEPYLTAGEAMLRFTGRFISATVSLVPWWTSAVSPKSKLWKSWLELSSWSGWSGLEPNIGSISKLFSLRFKSGWRRSRLVSESGLEQDLVVVSGSDMWEHQSYLANCANKIRFQSRESYYFDNKSMICWQKLEFCVLKKQRQLT